MSTTIEFTELIPSMIPVIIGVGLITVGVQALVTWSWTIPLKIRQKLKGKSYEARIENLSQSLSDATSLISSIEAEISERHKLVQKLKSDYKRYEKLAELKEQEVEAVVQSLRGELRRENSKSFWLSASLNFLFFLVGIIATVLLA